jgi:hypothetical protein
VACGTRGGRVFDRFVALLCSGGEQQQQQWPLLSSKVRALLTGRCHVGRGSTFDTTAGTVELFGGNAWVHCSLQTALKLKSLVDEEQVCWLFIVMLTHFLNTIIFNSLHRSSCRCMVRQDGCIERAIFQIDTAIAIRIQIHR